jgi:hypothetical protein
MPHLKLLIIGLVSGILSGTLGIGGGLVMIPAMVYLLGYPQHLAQGTSLAILVLPIGLLGAYRYYQAGNVQLGIVPYIAIAFFIGAYLGADWAQGLPQLILKRIFAACLLLVSLKMFLEK